MFLAHLSWKLKWAFLITCRLSSVRMSVRTQFTFSSYWVSFNNLGPKHPWVKGIQVYSNEEPINSHKGVNGFFLLLINIMEIICVYRFSRIFFSGERCGPWASCLLNIWKIFHGWVVIGPVVLEKKIFKFRQCIFVIISLGNESALSFEHNLNSLHPRKQCVKFDSNWPSGSGEDGF